MTTVSEQLKTGNGDHRDLHEETLLTTLEETTNQQTYSPFNQKPEDLLAGMTQRHTAWGAFKDWVMENLKDGKDYGSITGKTKKGREYTTKPFLQKPGSEKILNALGGMPEFPNLGKYEQMAIEGHMPSSVVLICEIRDHLGRKMAVGAAGRTLLQDDDDLNKCIKMTLKSAQIDATLRLGGLSELFTQDEDSVTPGGGNSQERTFSRDFVMPFGKHQDTAMKDLPMGYLEYMAGSAREAWLKNFCKTEIQIRQGDLQDRSDFQQGEFDKMASHTNQVNGPKEGHDSQAKPEQKPAFEVASQEQRDLIEKILKSHHFTDDERHQGLAFARSQTASKAGATQFIDRLTSMQAERRAREKAEQEQSGTYNQQTEELIQAVLDTFPAIKTRNEAEEWVANRAMELHGVTLSSLRQTDAAALKISVLNEQELPF